MSLATQPDSEFSPAPETAPDSSETEGVDAPPPEETETPSLRAWVHQGLRATFGLRLGALPADIHPLWVLCLFALATAFQIAARRLEIEGGALFSLSGWLYSWANTGLALTVLGGFFWASRRHWLHAHPVMAWLTLEWVTAVIFYTFGGALSA